LQDLRTGPPAGGAFVQHPVQLLRPKYDCVQESRPGVTSVLLKPDQALAYLKRVVSMRNDVSVTGIAGPGDPFRHAGPHDGDPALVRKEYPEMLLCVASNGIALSPYADALGRLKVSHATVTVNSLRPETCSKIYSWVHDGNKTLRGEDVGRYFVSKQSEAVKALVAAGVTVKINTILIPGVNEAEVGEVSECMASLGAKIMNVIPILPVEGTPFGTLPTPSAIKLAAVRAEGRKSLPQMGHCRRCRADAVGRLDEMPDEKSRRPCWNLPRSSRKNTWRSPHARVCTSTCTWAKRNISPFTGRKRMLSVWWDREKRRLPVAEKNGGSSWRKAFRIAEPFSSSGAGILPTRAMEEDGHPVLVMEGLLEDGLEVAFKGREIPCSMKPLQAGCGAGCGGTGLGCS
jgi:nitrogen fixation protein NifB